MVDINHMIKYIYKYINSEDFKFYLLGKIKSLHILKQFNNVDNISKLIEERRKLQKRITEIDNSLNISNKNDWYISNDNNIKTVIYDSPNKLTPEDI